MPPVAGNKNLEASGIAIHGGSSDLNIINCYIHPGAGQNTLTIEDFNKLIAKGNKDTIIVGDFNSRNVIWGSAYTCNQGRVIEDFMEKNNLLCLNDGSATYISNIYNTPSRLDITLVPDHMVANCEWEVLNELGSDHFPILTQYMVDNAWRNISNPKPKWNLKNANWGLFKSLCDKLKIEDFKNNNIDQYNNNLIDKVISIANKSIPISSKTNHKRAVPWWSMDIGKLIKDRNRARNKMKKNKSTENIKNFKELKFLVSEAILKAKKETWTSFCSSINHKVPSTEVWSKIKRIQGNNYKRKQVLNNNKIYNTNQKKADIFAETFGNNSSINNFDSKFRKKISDLEKRKIPLDAKYPNTDLEFNVPFTKQEFIEGFKNRKGTATGPDNFTYIFFKKMPDSTLDIFLDLFNTIWKQGYIPLKWKVADIFSLHKTGKDPCNPLNYRPISLTSNVCKTMEAMVTARLTHFLELNNLITPFQSGFRKHHSTNDHLVRLQTEINGAFGRGHKAIAVFVDIEKAYDMVWRHGLLEKTYKLGIRGPMYNFIERFITGRSFRVNVEGSFSPVTNLENGIPQGSVIAPIRFSIYINDLAVAMAENQKYKSTQFSIGLFADDTAFWRTGVSLPNLIKAIQIDLHNLEKWSETWGIKLSKEKTLSILFRNKKTGHIPLNLTLYNSPLTQVKKVKFLGVIFDQALTFRSHIDYIVDRCKGGLNLLRVLCGTNWGADRKMLLAIYNAYVVSILQYGAPAFCCAKPETLARLNVVQSKALKTIAGTYICTPTDSIQTELGVMPISLTRTKLCFKYWIKAKNITPNSPIAQLTPQLKPIIGNRSKSTEGVGDYFVTRMAKLAQACNIDQISLSIDKIKFSNPWSIPKPKVCFKLREEVLKTSYPPFRNVIFRAAANDVYNNFVHIYTDGSKDPITGKTGMAVYVEPLPPMKSFIGRARLNDNVSVYATELTAILHALLWIKSDNREFSDYVIFSDSLSALMAIEGSNSVRKDLVNKIIYVNKILIDRGLNIIYEWVPAHVGIVGNEKADTNAKKSLHDSSVGININMNYKELTSIIISFLNKIWQNEWNNKINSHHYNIHSLINKPGPTTNSRKTTRTLTRLRVGVVRGLGDTKFKCRQGTSADCQVCHTKDTVSHFLLECHTFDNERGTMLTELGSLGLNLNINNILNPPRDSEEMVYGILFKYI